MKRNKQSQSNPEVRKPARKRPEFKEGTLNAMRFLKRWRGGYQHGLPAWFEDIWDWEQPTASLGEHLHFFVSGVVCGVRELEQVKQNPDFYFFAKDAVELEVLSKRLQERHKAGELKGYSLRQMSFDEYLRLASQDEQDLASLCVAAAKADDPAFFRHLADCLERTRPRTLKHGERFPKGAKFKASVLQAYGDFLRRYPDQKPTWIDIANPADFADDKRRDTLRRQIEAAARKMHLPLLKKRKSG